MRLESSKDPTHAYLPALAACCGLLEYLTGLYRGKLPGNGWQQIAEFAGRYLPQPDYDEEAVRILFDVFRHPIAHRGIASGIWVDRNNGPGKGRLITWQVSADAKRPRVKPSAQRSAHPRSSLAMFVHASRAHPPSKYVGRYPQRREALRRRHRRSAASDALRRVHEAALPRWMSRAIVRYNHALAG